MSDADYAAFLEKANQDTGGATTQESKQYGTKSVNMAVPKSLERVEAIYISETDAEFEPVALAYSGSSISAGEFHAATQAIQGFGMMLTQEDRRAQEAPRSRCRCD